MRPYAIRRAELLMVCLMFLAAGCVPTGPRSSTVQGQHVTDLDQARTRACAADLRAWERAFSDQGLTLSEPRLVPGYPGLGTTRLLASFQVSRMTALQRADWLERLLAAGERRRAQQRRMFLTPGSAGEYPPDALERCARLLLETLPRDLPALEALEAAAHVEGEYVPARRVLGFYALTSLPIRAGIKRLQTEIHNDYAKPIDDLPLHGTLRRYSLSPEFFAPLAPAVSAGSSLLRRDSLGLLLPDSEASGVEQLFAKHAPVLEIDDAGSFDRPGVPYFDGEGRPALDSDTPRAFRYASLTRFAGELRLQLNYVFWFSERPRDGALDTLGGRLDGIVWRVTLHSSGRVLMYDSIHPCGCYQLFFPGEGVRLRAGMDALAEPPMVPQAAPEIAPDEDLVLRVSSATHFLQRVYAVPALAPAEGQSGAQGYKLASYRELYAVDGPVGARSLFARQGLVPGTARGERLYLWPTGVRSPGAMRERGRHATAFLGERHFDDADLLDQFFTVEENSSVSR